MGRSNRLLLALLAVAAGSVITSCASTRPLVLPPGTPIAPTTSIDVQPLGQKVTYIISIGNAHVEQDGNNITKTSEDFNTTAWGLRQLKYPATAQKAANALVASIVNLSADTSPITHPDGVVQRRLQADEGIEVTKSDALRHDLGLPPATVPLGPGRHLS